MFEGEEAFWQLLRQKPQISKMGKSCFMVLIDLRLKVEKFRNTFVKLMLIDDCMIMGIKENY